MGIAIATVITGVILGGLAAYRIWSALTGTSWTLGPLARVTRKNDPFSFWTSILPMGILALLLVLAALTHLFVSMK
jgi:hypothetical protein